MTDTSDFLNRLAQRFEESEQSFLPDQSKYGWGQFLDAPKRHRQVGMYGTCAGLIVLALAERGQSALTQHAASLLQHWWDEPQAHDGYGQLRFIQTLRLAVFNIAVRLCPSLQQQPICMQVKEDLLCRLLPSKMWGNYWVSEDQHDQTPRVFVTALTLLSFTLLRHPSHELHPDLMGVADELEKRFVASRDMPLYVEATAGAAILSVKERNIARNALRRLSSIGRSVPVGLDDQNVYFYDVEHSANEEMETSFSRGYLFVSTELLIGMAGLQAGASSSLRLRAEATHDSVCAHFEQNQYAYRPDVGERISTMNQAWAAIFLRLPLDGAVNSGRTVRIWYALIRNRKDNVWTGTVIPFVNTIIVTVLSIVVQSGGLFFKIVASLAILFIGSIYGTKAVERTLGRLIGKRS